MPLTVQGLPLVKPPYGRITALDLKSGTLAWQIAHGETPDNIRNHPALKGVTIPRTGRQGRIGTLVTKSLLIAGEGGFFTLPDGRRGAMLRAYDKATGKDAGAVYMPAPQTGSPMTYVLGGRQYIVVAVSGQNFPGELIAYRLPMEVVAASEAGAGLQTRPLEQVQLAPTREAESSPGSQCWRPGRWRRPSPRLAARAQGPERFSGPSLSPCSSSSTSTGSGRSRATRRLPRESGAASTTPGGRDRSKAARDRELYDLREYLQRAMYFSPGTLTPSMRLSAFLLEHDIRDQIESEPYLSATLARVADAGRAQHGVRCHRADASRHGA